MSDWNNTLAEFLPTLRATLDSSKKYAGKRSALRKAFAVVLEATHTNWQSSEFITEKWESGTWQDHAKLTRASASGLAQCFGSPVALLTQIVSLHLINSGEIKDAPSWVNHNAGMWLTAMTSHDDCAPATRGDGKTFGLHADWDTTWAESQGQARPHIDWCVDYAEQHWGVVIDKPNTSPAKADDDNDVVTPAIRTALDTLLASASMPSIDAIAEMENSVTALDCEVQELRKKLAEASKVTTAPVSVAASGSVPSGTVVMRNAADVFDVPSDEAKHFNFDVPYGEWDDVHPHVPALDDDYVFVINSLVPVLLAIVNGRIPWLKGHTGTGKTTLIEQVYARLNLPLFRLNLDSDITRGELVGREVLRTDNDGNTVTEFVEGIIPMAMQQPCGLLLDEIDASRPDLGFVLQRLTEGKGFMLLEDGGRTIMPHAHFRMFATANTNGRGDETGLYSGTRALGTAFVNRFKPYIEVDYMTEQEEAQLLQEKVPALDDDMARSIAAYATEHRVAFKQADVTLACSPRDTMSFAMAVVDYKRTMGSNKAIDTTRLAFEHSILNAADSDDRQVLDGLMARVFKSGE